MSRASSAGGPGPSAGTALVLWFRTHRRPLPWRRDRDPYRIWVAEVLLQQTRVAQAVPYFERFLQRFPTVTALANAPRAGVLKLWEGAGYYRRAHLLHDAARRIVAEQGGHLPSDVAGLERLPGVGPYTARAVAALAHDVPVVALEANGIRVAARWFREERDVRRPEVRRALASRLERLMPSGEAAAFNEGLMELGETVCLPTRPRCPICPVRTSCRARAELADPGELPRRPQGRRKPHVVASVVVLVRDGRWFLQRRPPKGLLGGLWEFPGGKVRAGEELARAAARELEEEVGVRADRWRPIGTVRHAYSHFTVELQVFGARPRGPVRTGPTRRWVHPEELGQLALPRATQKIVALLRASPTERTGRTFRTEDIRPRPRRRPRPPS